MSYRRSEFAARRYGIVMTVALVVMLVASKPGFAFADQTESSRTTPGTITPPLSNRAIGGTVFSSEGDRPIEGASVRVVGLATGAVARSTTSGTGAFGVSIAAPPRNHGDDRYEVRVTARGFFAFGQIVPVVSAHTMLHLTMSPDAGMLRGVIRSSQSASIAASWVRVTSEATGASTFVRSDRFGRFALTAPALPWSSATNQYQLRVRTLTGPPATELLTIAPGTMVHTVLHVGYPDMLRPDAGASRTPDNSTSPSRDGVRLHRNRTNGTASRPMRGAVDPTPVPACPSSRETSWTGKAGDNTWETAGNWSNGVPTLALYACIPPGSASIAVNATNPADSAAGLLLGTGDRMDLKTGSLTLDGSSTPSAFEGSLTVESGATVNVNSGSLLLNAAHGSIVNKGSFLVGGSFEQDTGTVVSATGDGPVDLLNAASLRFAGAGAGAFVAADVNSNTLALSLAGNLAAGQSLDVETQDACTEVNATVDAAASFTNAGAISLGEEEANPQCGGGDMQFNLPKGGTLTNTGTFTVSGQRNYHTTTFTGDLDNQGGALNAVPLISPGGNGSTNLVFASGDVVTNTGTINASSGSSVTVAAGASVANDAGGVITSANPSWPTGQCDGCTAIGFVVGGSFTQNAGQVTGGSGNGPVLLVNGASVAFDGTGSGSFVADDAGSDSLTLSLSRNVAVGQSLDVRTRDACTGVTATVNAAASFTNAGAISMGEESNPQCGGGDMHFNLLEGDTLTNTGTFTVTGQRNYHTTTFAGNFVNQGGTVNVLQLNSQGNDSANLVFAAGDTFGINTGAVNVAAGSLISLPSGSSFTNGPGGHITSANSPVSTSEQRGFIDSGSFIQDAGLVSTGVGGGPVDMENGFSLTFGGTGAGQFVVFDAANDNPTASLSGDIAPSQSLQIETEDFCDHADTTTVNAAGSFTNAGTIDVDHFDNNCGSSNLAFDLSAGGAITNTGSISVMGDPNGGTSQTFTGSLANAGSFTVATNANVVIDGNLTDFSGSTTGADVLSAPRDVPMIQVVGSAQVAGTLNFETDPSTQLTVGASYSLLNSPTVSGGFAYVTGLFAGDGLTYDVAQAAAAVSFTIASENSSPEVFAMSPSAGPAGSSVTVFGSDLIGASSVAFGSKRATEVDVLSATELTTVVPGGSGTVPVTVTTPKGTSPMASAPKFTYATKPSGSAGSASLHLTLRDAAGLALPGVTVGVADAKTRNSLGYVLTGSDGSGTLRGLSTGQTVQVTVLETLPPYGPASSAYTLTSGLNDKMLELPVQPLISSDPSARAPTGSSLAIWPITLTGPGTPIPGGALVTTTTLADVEFTLGFKTGESVLLSSDAAGAKPFCVDGSWTLTMSDSATNAPSTLSGSGCPGKSGPINLGTALDLSPGTYGGELQLTAPQGATTAGSTDVYLLPPPGTASELRAAPGSLVSHARFSGSDTATVGQTSALNMTLGGLPVPGATGYHARFGFDPAGISVTALKVPAGWDGGFLEENLADGDGGFTEETSTNSIPVGGTVVTLDINCDEAGIWPVTFAGDYWLPQSGAGYTDAVVGSATVVCNGPPPSPTTSPTGVSIDPSNGDVSVTVTGSNLSGATTAELLDTSGSVMAKSMAVSAASTTVTAEFPPTPPGLYDIVIDNADGGDLAQTAGTPFEVAPALPQFGMAQADVIGNVPGIATGHLFKIGNTGTVNGTAIVAFTFPKYVAPEPALAAATAPAGTRLLVHGKTQDGWVEYAAIPLAAGESADVSWTVTVPGAAVFGSRGITAFVGMPVGMEFGLVGQFTAGEWRAVSNDPAPMVVRSSFTTGTQDYTRAVQRILSLPAADQVAYLQNLPSLDQLGGLEAYFTALQAASVLDYALHTKQLLYETKPAGIDAQYCDPNGCVSVSPAPTSDAAQPPDSLDDPMATYFANFIRNSDAAIGAGFANDSQESLSARSGPVLTYLAGKTDSSVGAAEEYHTGYLVS